MPRHPNIVPGQHHHGKTENAGVENFLASAAEELRKSAGKERDYASPQDTGADAAADPQCSAGNAGGYGHHDADDQAGLKDLAKNDDECCEHARLTQLSWVWRPWSWRCRAWQTSAAR